MDAIQEDRDGPSMDPCNALASLEPLESLVAKRAAKLHFLARNA